MKTVILGNGIIALTIAFRLTRRCGPNDQIVIVGPRARQGSATLAAAAMLNSFGEIEAGSLETELDLFRFELSHLATQMWPRFEKELIQAAGSCLPRGCTKCQGFSGGGCVECGTYVINNTAADDLDDENFDAILAALKNFNEPHELVSPRDIPNYMPEPHHRATRALYIPNEGWFNPRLMIEKLDGILGRHPQVQFLDHPVQRLQAAGGRIEAAVIDDAIVITGDNFVLATGASVTEVLTRSQLDLNVQRIFYGVGVSVEIRSPEFPHTKCIRTPNRGLACGIYSVPYFTESDVPNDHILIGATNFTSPTPYPHGRLGSAEPLMRGAMEQINTNFYKADLLRINVGWRPTSQDTYPLLGRTSLPNLLIASGTKRDGFHMSPLISEHIVAMLYGEATDPRLAWFAPDRAPIRSLTREQAITKAIRHQMSAAYQHGYAASPSLKSEQIRTMLRDGLERLHDQVGAVDWGIPPEMLDMYRYGHARS